ncbi:SDR family NAD(P)-dependent oxidoreductase [Sphingobium sp. AP49]|uniref:SDR family NAD(P)-dependent oxidoreductase n=1 Tax=Sphingobium sp. AP49 TaxID=1144307 RepID=UPI00026ECF0E|nr:SDR family NAD(P)-dependent oxidoreductase [Sphingobium sp. AP49]WHO37922.1 SDR family NAD(P)-dependent oxidoreductase [Sphingobium sp. AP49]
MVEQVRVAVVTGASSGIGKAIAKAMARQGWRVIGTGRDPGRLATAEAEIRGAAAGAQVDMLRADLSLLDGALQLARDIAALTDRVDVLFNNAGGMTDALVMTDEGLEANFAGNHLGPFLLTQRLLPLLRKAAADQPAGAVRILNTASDASEMIPAINLDDLQNLERFSPGMAYCTGKLANVLFARALARRLSGEGIVAHAVHPGAVDSNFFSHAPADTQARSLGLDKASEAEGADTLVWLATETEGGANGGGYWYRRALRTPNPLVDDPAVVARFWDESENLIAKHLR